MAVDIANGVAHIERVDAVVGGRVPLRWWRRYATSLISQGPTPLGIGWTSNYFARLIRQPRGYRMVTPEGDEDVFEDPNDLVRRGGVIRNFATFQELTRIGGHYSVTRWDVDTGLVERYVFARFVETNVLALSAIENVCGDGLDLVWDDSGRLEEVRQRSEARAIVLAYDDSGRIVSGSLRAASGEVAPLFEYGYDAFGHLVNESNAAGVANRFQYDERSRLSREINSDGGVFDYWYDSTGRCVRYSGRDHYNEKLLRYLVQARITEVRDSRGNLTVYRLMPTGQIESVTDALGGVLKYHYDAHGRVIAETDALGKVTAYTYDAWGNRNSITNALGNAFSFDYREDHLPIRITDPAGHSWDRKYDADARLCGGSDPLGATWRIHFNAAGEPVRFEDALEGCVEQRFERGLLCEVIDRKGYSTRYQLDPWGRLIARIEPDGARSEFVYDSLGRLIETCRPDNTRTLYHYDTAGNFTGLTDGAGNTTRYLYGPCGRLAQRISPLGTRLRFVWGSEPGLLKEIINEKEESYRFAYDELGRCICEQSFDGRVTMFRYDAVGNAIEKVNGIGERTRMRWDELGHLLDLVCDDGTSLSYAYDSLGDISAATCADSEVEIERDAIGQIIRERQGNHWVESQYDLVGNLRRTSSSTGHEVLYRYDANYALAAFHVGAGRGAEVQFDRDPCGREARRRLPGNVEMTRAYDVAGRLSGQTVRRDAKVSGWTQKLVERTYAYDAAERLDRVDDAHHGDTRYRYDEGGQLLHVDGPGSRHESFSYDSTGNCTMMTRHDSNHNSFDTLVYGVGSRIVSKGDTSYRFDAQGRLVEKTEQGSSTMPQAWHFEWNQLDQLRAVHTPAGNTVQFKYDAFGRRIEKLTPRGRHTFLWDKERVLQEMRTDGAVEAWIFERHGFAPLAKVDNGALLTVVCDHLGTPRELINGEGRLVWSDVALAWGAPAGVSKAVQHECAVRFPGQWRDSETGLHYNFYRYYDPDRGAFISQDPLGPKASPNSYRYTRNPVNCIDPFGLTALTCRGADGKGYVIYHIVEEGPPPEVVYVGLTQATRFNDRVDEHAESGRLGPTRFMAIADYAENYGQARGFEQAHMDFFGTVNAGDRGQPFDSAPGNRQNSYDEGRLDGDQRTTSYKRAAYFDENREAKQAELEQTS